MTDHSVFTSDVRSATPPLPRIVRLLVAARAVNRLAAFSLPFLGLLLVEYFGWTTAAVGWTLTAFGVATIPSRLLGGRLADALGRRTTLVAGLLGCAVSQLILSVAGTTWSVLTGVVLLGLCFEIYEPPSQALLADHVPVADQPRAYGLMAAAMAGSAVLAGALAALLSGWDLRLLFVADAASCTTCALIVRLALPAEPRRIRSTRDEAGLPSSPWHDPRLLTLLGLQTLFAMVYLQSTIALPLSLVERGLGPWTLGVLLATSAATIVVGQPLLRLRRLRTATRAQVLTAGYLLLALGLLGYAVSTGLAAFVAATIVAGLGDLLLMGHLITTVAAIAPAAQRAGYLAVFGLSWGFASVLAPAVGTGLLAAVGVTATWTVLAVLSGGLALLARRQIATTA